MAAGNLTAKLVTKQAEFSRTASSAKGEAEVLDKRAEAKRAAAERAANQAKGVSEALAVLKKYDVTV